MASPVLLLESLSNFRLDLSGKINKVAPDCDAVIRSIFSPKIAGKLPCVIHSRV